MRGWSLLLSAAIFFTAALICGAQEGSRKLTPREMEVLNTLTNHKEKIKQAVDKADSALEMIGKIQKQVALTNDELKKLNELARGIDVFKAELSDKGKVLAELQVALQKSTDDRAKADEAMKQLQQRMAKLEVGGAAERIEKLQEQANKYKLNTEVRVNYFGPAPGRQPYYEVTVVSVTGKAKVIPGAKIDVVTELAGIEGKPVPYVADQNGVVKVPRPDVKKIRGLHHIDFNYAGDEVHQTSSRKMQIK